MKISANQRCGTGGVGGVRGNVCGGAGVVLVVVGVEMVMVVIVELIYPVSGGGVVVLVWCWDSDW